MGLKIDQNTIYTILCRSVNCETGQIEVFKTHEGTQEELVRHIQVLNLRARLHVRERYFLMLKEMSEYVAYILRASAPDYKEINKFAEEI